MNATEITDKRIIIHRLLFRLPVISALIYATNAILKQFNALIYNSENSERKTTKLLKNMFNCD